MKTNYFISKKLSIYSLFGLILVAVTSCGSYQNKSYYDNDGIYDNNQTSKKTTENSESNKYKEYFGSLNKENEEIFTNVENYSSYDDSINNSAQIENNTTGYASWGSNASDNITVNVYGNNMSGFGYWNNWYGPSWGWNSWYGSNWGFNNWGFNNWGFNNWGFNNFYGPNWGWNSWYGPSWGFNNWGFNNFYGPNWGWNSGYYNNYNYAHSNGRRNLNNGYNSGAVNYSYGRSSTVSPSIRNTVGTRNVNPTRNNSIRDYNSSSTPRTNTYSNPRNNTNTPRTNQNATPTRDYNNSSTPRTNTNSNPRTNSNTTPSTPRSYNSPSYTPSSSSTPRSSGSSGSYGGGRSGGRR